ncbi:MAG: hypothetical protein ACFFD4_12835 [Candidatus Odinarchaeota archaeon]
MTRQRRKRWKNKDAGETRKQAKSQVKELLAFSRKIFSEHPDNAKNAVKTARKMAMKTNLRLDSNLKLTHCKKCFVPFTSSTLRVRTAKDHQRKVIYSCKNCGFRKRYHIDEKDTT